MHLNHKEITLLYNADNPRDKKTLAYALTLGKKINKQDILSVDTSATLFEYMVEALGVDVKEVINKADPDYQAHHRGHVYKPKMWFKAIKVNPNLLKAPIAMCNNKAILCCNPSDVLKLG